tara:strand:- start:10733 stop:10897 length:165 start_codon:yes stop_codon:yes gene_type:complete
MKQQLEKISGELEGASKLHKRQSKELAGASKMHGGQAVKLKELVKQAAKKAMSS